MFLELNKPHTFASKCYPVKLVATEFDEPVIWSNPNKLPVKEFKDGIGITFYEGELKFLKINSSKYGYDYSKGINTGLFSK